MNPQETTTCLRTPFGGISPTSSADDNRPESGI